MLIGDLCKLLIQRLAVIDGLIAGSQEKQSLLLSPLNRKAFVQSFSRLGELLTFIRDSRNNQKFEPILALTGSSFYQGNPKLVEEFIRFRNDFTHSYCYEHLQGNENTLQACFTAYTTHSETLKTHILECEKTIPQNEDCSRDGKRPKNRHSTSAVAISTLEEYMQIISYLDKEKKELKMIMADIENESIYATLATHNSCQNILQMIEDSDVIFFKMEESEAESVDQIYEKILEKQSPLLKPFLRYRDNERKKLAHGIEEPPSQLEEAFIQNCLNAADFYDHIFRKLKTLAAPDDEPKKTGSNNSESQANDKTDEFGRNQTMVHSRQLSTEEPSGSDKSSSSTAPFSKPAHLSFFPPSTPEELSEEKKDLKERPQKRQKKDKNVEQEHLNDKKGSLR